MKNSLNSAIGYVTVLFVAAACPLQLYCEEPTSGTSYECRTLIDTAECLVRPIPIDLADLHVVGPLFDDAALHRLRKCVHLRRLHLDSTAVSTAGLERFLTDRPEVVVTTSFKWANELFRATALNETADATPYDILAMIRASNYLRSLTRSQALAFLREYVRNSTMAEQDGLLLLIPWCFEAIMPNGSPIDPKEGSGVVNPLAGMASLTGTPWSTVIVTQGDIQVGDSQRVQISPYVGQVRVRDGIPFIVTSGFTVYKTNTRPPESREYLLDWAAAHAHLLNGRLVPGNPWDAADAVYQSVELTAVHDRTIRLEDAKTGLYNQARKLAPDREFEHQWSDILQAYVTAH